MKSLTRLQAFLALLRGQDGFAIAGFDKKKLISGVSREGWDVAATSRVRCALNFRLGRARIEEHVEVAVLEGQLDALSIGRSSYAGHLVLGGVRGRLSIGSFCSVGTRVLLLCGDGYHRSARVSTYPFPFKPPFSGIPVADLFPDSSFEPSQIALGHDVWVGNDVTILKGVVVGNGAIIAASSVVTHDVPPYAIVAGNPAVIKKYRHDEETVRLLSELKWWDWPYEDIRRRIALFRLSGDELKRELLKISGGAS